MGYILEDGVKKPMEIMDVLHLIKTRQFVIYGNGYIARRFYNIIKNLGLEHNVLNVAISEANPDDIGVDGKFLCSIKDIGRDAFIVLAVHDAVADEMKRTLIELGFSDYIWIYPYLIELEIGSPIKSNCSIPTDALIRCLPNAYAWAIYYLTLKDYVDKDLYHGSLYIKFASLYITSEMAFNRWERYRRRIEEHLCHGYYQDYNVKINEEYDLIDGSHRLVLAKFFHAKIVYADIYAGHKNFYCQKGLGKDILLLGSDLSNYYTPDEIARIQAADRELRN